MKIVLIVLIIPCFFSSRSFAQVEKTFDTTITSSAFQQFFLKNNAVDSVQFTIYKSEKPVVWIYGLDNQSKKTSRVFTFRFAGDDYLFKKKYNDLALPLNAIEKLAKHACDLSYYIDGSSYNDTIRMQIKYQSPEQPKSTSKTKSIGDDEEDWDKVFTKVETGVGISNGEKTLITALADAIAKNKNLVNNSIRDSVAMFQAVVRPRDSLLSGIKIIEGESSLYTETVRQVLAATPGWTPANACGRPVNSYIRIFVRLNRDGSVLIDWTGR